MRAKWLRTLACGLALALAAPFFSACTAEDAFNGGGSGGGATRPPSTGNTSSSPQVTNPDYVRTPPPLNLAVFDEAAARTGSGTVEAGPATAWLDTSNTAKGYMAVRCEAPSKARLVMMKGTDDRSDPSMMQFELDFDGTPNYFTFPQGDGDYYVKIYVLNRVGEEGPLYTPILEGWVSVQMEDEFAPFLVNNREMDYDADSKAVLFSYDLTRHCATDLEVAQQIYAWIQDNVEYDTDKVDVVRAVSGYVPDPDDTLATKKGICYDYASLAGTMLRANGIPCKMVKGDALVDPDTGEWVYHAWNLIYLEEAGWIAVQIPTVPGDYFRIDLTFAASFGGGRAAADHILNDANYSTIQIT